MTIRSSYPIFLLAFCALVLASVAAFNYRIDPAHLFDEGKYAKSAARLMANGNDILAANLDERLLQKHYAAMSPSAPGVLVLGSSRIMEIDSGMMAGGRLYNAGLSTATLPDLLALVELFIASRDQSPRTVLIGIDPWTFEAAPRNSRWHTLAPEYRTMLARIGGGKPRPAPRGGWESVLELISLAYLKRSLERFDGGLAMLVGPRFTSATTANGRQDHEAVKRADGSLVYSANHDARGEQEVAAAALSHAAKHATGVLRANPLDPGTIDRFEALIRWLIGQKVRVILLLPPFHPVHYAYLEARDQSRSLARIAATVKAMAHRRNAEVIGSFDPAGARCGTGEFRDGVHARPACLRRIMNSTSWADHRQ